MSPEQRANVPKTHVLGTSSQIFLTVEKNIELTKCESRPVKRFRRTRMHVVERLEKGLK